MTTQPSPSPALPDVPQGGAAEVRKQRLVTAAIVLGAIVLLALVGFAIYWMGINPGTTETIRDIFIILAAVVLLFIMLALIVLIVQLARLTNLLQHEIKPILDSTNETVNTVRGTAEFLSDNLVEPVMKLNSYLAALKKMLDLLKLGGS